MIKIFEISDSSRRHGSGMSVYFKPLGNTREKVPALGLGTKGIHDYHSAEEAIAYAFDLGLKLVEVSEQHGHGLAEELVGRIIKRYKRDDIFIVLRIECSWFSDTDTVVRAVTNNLRRMSTSYVDVVLLDNLCDIIPLEIQAKALESLVDKGLARYIGVSNLRLKDIVKISEAFSKHSITVIQAKYSVLDKKVEKDVLRYAIDRKITLIACRPLEQGEVKKSPRLSYISRKYGKTALQVALNYLISKPNVIAIPKSEKRPHIDEIYGSLGWGLSDEDIRFLERNI